MKKARIFNIQKFSLHDGPGIRTVVFFKGCPLKCPWCSNPESQKYDIELVWDSQKCSGCKKCTSNENVEFINDRKKPYRNLIGEYMKLKTITYEEGEKIRKLCPNGAVSYEGYDILVDEIYDEVIKDLPFYEESGGGVTLSGGEVLLQSDVAIELLKKLKSNNIHTAAETTCYAPNDKFKEFVKYLDLLLCDIKHWDSEKSNEVTGVGLEKIYENIKYATGLKYLEVIGRIPVIPDFNYSKKDAEQFVEMLKMLVINKINLLPYHNFGENKYKIMNKEYELAGIKQLHKDDKEFVEYTQIFKNAGIIVK